MRLFSDHLLQALDPAERTWVEQLRTLCREEIGPRAAAVGREDVFAWDNFRLLCEAGIVGTAFPRAYGGSEARMLLRVRLIEELGRVCSASASLITGTDLSTRAIVAGASEVSKQALLPGLCSGALQAAFALSEPAAGSDVRGITTTVVRDGDAYRLNGRKKYITRANTADWLVVVARLVDDAAAPVRDGPLVAVLVASKSPGVAISAPVAKLSWYGVPICDIAFSDVAVPLAQQLGAVGDGFALAQDALLRARIGHAAMALGRAIGAIEIAAQYCNERDLFGERLGSKQGVQWMLADLVTQVEASRLLVAHAAASYDRGDADAGITASMAKLHATDLGMRVVTDALQLTGGRGFLQSFPLERFFRDAKLNQVGEGSSEVHKTVIGRHIVRRARDAERNPCLDAGPTTDY
jgi:alkylation response protein AidB-like acyl-CoA dehydrogenase